MVLIGSLEPVKHREAPNSLQKSQKSHPTQLSMQLLARAAWHQGLCWAAGEQERGAEELRRGSCFPVPSWPASSVSPVCPVRWADCSCLRKTVTQSDFIRAPAPQGALRASVQLQVLQAFPGVHSLLSPAWLHRAAPLLGLLGCCLELIVGPF